MRTITVWNLKGGVGKTTTTVNLAYIFAKKGYRTLVIDLDPQVNTTPIFTQANEIGKTVQDVFEHPEQIRRAIYRTKYASLDIIKGSVNLGEGYSVDILQKALGQVTSDYDVVLIDCQPSCGSLTATALYAADIVLSPVVLDRFCLDNLRTVEDILSELNAEWRVFANKVKNIKSQRNIYQEIMEMNDFPFLDTCISERATVPNALALRKPLERHSSRSVVTEEFQSLAEELKGVF